MEVSEITDSCNNNLGSKIQIEEDVPIDWSLGVYGSTDKVSVLLLGSQGIYEHICGRALSLIDHLWIPAGTN